MKVKDIKLGQKVKDKVTGMEGIVVHHARFLNGCHQLGIQSEKMKDDGSLHDTYSIDIQQLDVVGEGINEEIEQEDVGGPVKFKSNYGR